jgi:addiction module RelE/StbE family toxin
MSKVILSRKAESDLDNLPKKDQKKVVKKIRSLEEEPFLGKQLVGKLKGLRSLRTWPYRIIYEFQKPSRVIILKIIHRKDAYR